MPDSFELETFVAAEPARIYKAWLDAREHAAMTGGGEATVEPWVGGRFTAFDGYVHGIILGLDDGRRIVQTWRTVDFAPEMRDARVVVELEAAKGGTRVRIRQSDTPVEQVTRYRNGWDEHYLSRFAKYFARKRNEQPEKPPTAKEKAAMWGRGGKRTAAAAKKPAAAVAAPPKKAAVKKAAGPAAKKAAGAVKKAAAPVKKAAAAAKPAVSRVRRLTASVVRKAATVVRKASAVARTVAAKASARKAVAKKAQAKKASRR